MPRPRRNPGKEKQSNVHRKPDNTSVHMEQPAALAHVCAQLEDGATKKVKNKN